GFQIAALPGAGGSSGGQNENCSLEVILPATIFLNDISSRTVVCSEEAASWNSTEEITYQYNSRIQRSRMGNYWADYNGTDEDGDGIGDQPALLNDNNIDYHPLISSVDSYKTSDEEEPKAGLIQANVGEPFTITLPSNPSTGYTWTFDYDYVLLKAEQAEFEPPAAQSIRIGSGGSSVFIFTPIATGKTTIRFVYKRPWENIVAETRTYYVDISGQEERTV
ncbi:MAG: protease inhibitor I42 family protein, partial [Methanothrix sp.]|nr:protease inhibitor I42 family protein [Methanothrix sp.]